MQEVSDAQAKSCAKKVPSDGPAGKSTLGRARSDGPARTGPLWKSTLGRARRPPDGPAGIKYPRTGQLARGRPNELRGHERHAVRHRGQCGHREDCHPGLRHHRQPVLESLGGITTPSDGVTVMFSGSGLREAPEVRIVVARNPALASLSRSLRPSVRTAPSFPGSPRSGSTPRWC